MLDIKRLMQISLLTVVLTSSILLALSTNSLGLFLVASICAVGGFVLTDLLKWFRIEGWLANVVSIAILVLAMKDFFNVDSSGKLMAVSNLLVYLQGVLMFQVKTPRLNWQILVLSLLQIVITTIFSVGFSNSYLLLFYFIATGVAMVLQTLYTESVDVARRNKSVVPKMKAVSGHISAASVPTAFASSTASATPLTLFDDPGYRQKTLLRVMGRLFYWMIASLVFTLVLFLMAPRTSKPLFQPISYKVSATGFNNEVNLNETGVIRGSNNIIFTAKMTDAESDSPLRFGNTPYFRSMALSTLTIEDGQTNWRAPFDRVDNSFYRSLPRPQARVSGREVKQVITVEQTTNPMIYGVTPIFSSANTAGNIEFCSEISAYVRARADGKVSMAPFKYELSTFVDDRNFTLWGSPHYGGNARDRNGPISDNSLTHQWLTEIDRERYPVLVAEAERLAAENDAEKGDLLDLVDKFNDYFSGNRFKYTLDYRKVPRNTTIDSVEDFFANHRAGHCEMYASALTLMLRSQNIPARLVVGFMAKDYNELTDSYTVRGKHAHAWVEVYFHPLDCTQDMFAQGIAGRAGAWVTADPNPIATLAGSSEITSDPIELARTVWQDMVLGMEGSEERDKRVNTFFLYAYFQDFFSKSNNSVTTIKSLATNSYAQIVVAGILAIFLFVRIYIRSSRIKARRKRKNLEQVGIFRRLVASAVGLISSDLEQWVLKGDERNTQFYDRFVAVLKADSLERADYQTQREFAEMSVLHYRDRDQLPLIESVIRNTTRRFYEVRFGDRVLTQKETEQLERDLQSLKLTLTQQQVSA